MKGLTMPHPVMIKSTFKSIVKQESTDVFFLVTEEDTGKKYRVLPKGFTIHAEPHLLKFFFGNKQEILL